MSQPPPMMPYGYSPPGYAPPGYATAQTFWPYYDRAPDAMFAPARRAGWVLIGMGVAGLLLGTCIGAVFGALAPAQLAQLLQEMQKQQPANAQLLAVTTQQLRAVMIALGVFLAVVGLVAVALGALVRGGRRVWIVIAMIACALLLIYFAFVLLASLLAGPASLLGSALMLALPLSATVFAMRFLIEALRNATQIEAAQREAAYRGYAGATPDRQIVSVRGK